MLATITPEALDLPDEIITLIPPKAFGFGSVNTELFEGRTDPVFDPLGAASIAADMAISGLLQHQRAARMNAFHAQNAEYPAFTEVLDAFRKAVSGQGPRSRPRHRGDPAHCPARVRPAPDGPRVERNRRTAGPRRSDRNAPPDRFDDHAPNKSLDAATNAHRAALSEDITRFMNRPDATFKRVNPLPTPAGDPIGGR